ncbi:MAG: DNA-processing protein DprA [Hyphomicrobiaceae bacterium]|nr:DNA-processing protein DprA [Hyphomicrobiaceae bacterium]
MPRAKPQTPELFAPAPLPVAPLDIRERIACLRLIRSDGIGPLTFRQVINRFGGAEAAVEELPGYLARSCRATRQIAIAAADVAERELEAAAKVGARAVFTIEPGYPPRLAMLDAPPPLIYVLGRDDLLARPSLAIVGARDASAAGSKLARLFAAGLGEAGLAIVSGLARGIDASAHEASLSTGTIAVVAGGVDVVYPPEHAKLHRRLAEEGAIVSEMPCGFVPRGRDFPRRNRLISGIALGVLIVEAARRSGSLVTARHAGEQGREVFAVPGHPLDPRAEGTNHLLKSGATLVTEAADIIAALRPLSGCGEEAFGEPWRSNPVAHAVTDGAMQAARRAVTAATPQPSMAAAREARDARDIQLAQDVSEADRARVLSALGAAPVDTDEVARATYLPIGLVRSILLDLDLEGLIVRHGAQLVSRTPEAG